MMWLPCDTVGENSKKGASKLLHARPPLPAIPPPQCNTGNKLPVAFFPSFSFFSFSLPLPRVFQAYGGVRKTCFETRREAIPCDARSRQRARRLPSRWREIQGFTPRMGYGEGYLFRSPADLIEKMLFTSTTVPTDLQLLEYDSDESYGSVTSR